MYNLLKAKADFLSEHAVDFSKKLIQAKSYSCEEGEAAKLIKSEMIGNDFDDVFIDASGNVIGLVRGRRSTAKVLLTGHVDTVPLKSANEWQKKPFEGTIENGKLYGLGASDCKGGIASQIYAASLLKNSLLPCDGDLIVALTVSEENGGSVGIRNLLNKTLPELDLKPDFAILCEPTNLALYYGHDGWMELEIKVEGIDQFQVDDAAKGIYKDWEKHFNAINKRLKSEEASIRPPVYKNNKGIRSATIEMARRLHESEIEEEIISNLAHEAKILASMSGNVAVEISVKTENKKSYTGIASAVKHITNAWATDPFNPFLKRAHQSLIASGCEARTGKWKLGRLGMGTSGGMLVNEYKIPVIGYGPGNEDNAHNIDEFVEVKNIKECIYGTASIVHGLIGTPVFGWTMDEI